MESGLPPTLLDLLSTSLVLARLAPYLPVRSLLALGATCKTADQILRDAPEAFRYVDLTPCRAAVVPDMSVDHGGINWRSQRMDEALTEDDIYCGPLRGIFSSLKRRSAMQRVQTLILDGLTVPADLVSEIMANTNVRILSIRECRNLNHDKLTKAIKYAVRPSRPEGTPKLRGMYVFCARDKRSRPGFTRRGAPASVLPDSGITSSQGAQIGAEWNSRSQDALSGCGDRWYMPSGKVAWNQDANVMNAWAETLQACEGIIAFDAVLCRGPRHDTSSVHGQPSTDGKGWLPAKVATVALGQHGCATCKSSPEQPAVFGESPVHHLPLLDPPSLHSTLVEVAQRPGYDKEAPRMFARCDDCLTARWCERCSKWWDEDCYRIGPRTSEVRQAAMAYDSAQRSDVRVFLGLCTESCLVSEEMSGSGSGGMWG